MRRDEPRRRGVERIGGLIHGALNPRVRASLEGWSAIDRWPEVAGPEAAKRSKAVAFKDGRLIVEVQNSVWMCQLSAMKRSIIERLNGELGRAVVEDIVFRINPVLSTDPGGGEPSA